MLSLETGIRLCIHKKHMNIYSRHLLKGIWVRIMVFNATFNNILIIPWRSALFVEETGVPRENHRHVASH